MVQGFSSIIWVRILILLAKSPKFGGMETTEVPLSEAKAKFSQLLRRVARGERIVITVHGIPMAELGPAEGYRRATTVEGRTAQLIATGELVPATKPRKRGEPLSLRPIAHVPGALQRFLDER